MQRGEWGGWGEGGGGEWGGGGGKRGEGGGDCNKMSGEKLENFSQVTPLIPDMCLARHALNCFQYISPIGQVVSKRSSHESEFAICILAFKVLFKKELDVNFILQPS
jgi:hypothetical protein